MANRYRFLFQVLVSRATRLSAIAQPRMFLMLQGENSWGTTPGISAVPGSCAVGEVADSPVTFGDDSVVDVTGDVTDTGITIEDRGHVTITRRRDHYET